MIELTGVSKRYPSGHLAVSGIDLRVERHEIVALIGPSGCGKSTILRLVAGLDQPTAGQAQVAGHRVEGPDRSAGIVFQQPRLMPWLTVGRNVAFGLDPVDGTPTATSEVIDRVGLGAFADALPRELSGGMAQRVAIARALVTKPPVLLLDEPFSALDAFTRIDLQTHLLEVWEWYQPTTLLVTHDIDEALVLADRVIVLGGTPGPIRADITVDLLRPRSRSDPEFHRLQDLAMGELGRSRQAYQPM
ncbi:MAG TPA: ABC transporter ATP-binding protein [Acidimicrobiia bacterium]|nr:ABC transporter ATP-binding protein [Acidimicrobiia bacterium]